MSEETPARLTPVETSYDPGYPDELDQPELDELLRPGLVRRFGEKVLRLGAILGGASALAIGAVGVASGEQISGTAPDLRVSSNAQLDAKVNQWVAKIRGPENKGVHPRASDKRVRELPSNIDVRYPYIQVFYGNSYMGFLDEGRAKVATKQLFALYGIHLQDDVPIKGNGYEFTADGYDPATKTGFELLPPPHSTKTAPHAQTLEPGEMSALDADVRDGKIRMFVARSDRFPVVDLDPNAHWTYYLEAVAEYLRWIHRP